MPLRRGMRAPCSMSSSALAIWWGLYWATTSALVASRTLRVQVGPYPVAVDLVELKRRPQRRQLAWWWVVAAAFIWFPLVRSLVATKLRALWPQSKRVESLVCGYNLG